MLAFVAVFVRFLVLAVWVLMLARVLLSWIDPTFRGAGGRFVYSTTEPILAPIRRALPRTGMFDFSPIIVVLALALLIRVVGLP